MTDYNVSASVVTAVAAVAVRAGSDTVEPTVITALAAVAVGESIGQGTTGGHSTVAAAASIPSGSWVETGWDVDVSVVAATAALPTIGLGPNIASVSPAVVAAVSAFPPVGATPLTSSEPLHVTLEIDADPNTSGVVLLDTSALDGSDVLADSPSWVEVPVAHIRRASVRRGGDRWRYDAGDMVVELDNRAADYDPDEPSTYAINGATLIRPGMRGRLKATVNGTSQTLFTGRLADVNVSHDVILPTVTWLFEDSLADLGRVDVSPAGGAVDDNYTIAFDLLDEAGVGYATNTSPSTRDVVRPGDGSARDALHKIAASIGGRLFADKDNTVRLDNRADESGKTSVLTLNPDETSPKYQSVDMSPGFKSAYKSVRVSYPNGDDVTAAAPDAAAVQHDRTLSVDTVLANHSSATYLAEWLAGYYGRVARVVTNVTCRPDGWKPGNALAAAAVELGDVITVRLLGGGSVSGTVERIAWDLSPGGVSLQFGLDRYDPGGYGSAEWFVLDTSALDGPSILAYS